MHFKDKHGVSPPQEDTPWEGETWDLRHAHEYIKSKPGSCVVVIDDYFVDVTKYLGEHVSQTLPELCYINQCAQPGGAVLMRKYSVRPEQDLIEASWAFDGGLK